MNQPVMRAKMIISRVDRGQSCEILSMRAVCKADGYDATGDDENNTYARWTPSADLRICIQNPALFGTFSEKQQLYVDFSLAQEVPA